MGNARNMVFWVVLFLMVLALFNLFSSPPGNTGGDARSYSDFVAAVDGDRVTNVVIDGGRAALYRRQPQFHNDHSAGCGGD